MKTIGLRLTPLDVLFFRDARPFGATSRAMTGLPTPQVVAGALRTALLQKYRVGFDKVRDAADFAAALKAKAPDQAWIAEVRFRGPWFTRQHDTGGTFEVLVPTPATLHGPKKGKEGELALPEVLRGGELPGWKEEDSYGLRPLWLRGCEAREPLTGFLTLEGLKSFLEGNTPNRKHLVKPETLFGYDNRTGIAVNPDQLTAAESQIYGIRFLAPQVNVGLYAEAVVPQGAPKDALDDIDLLALGGEGKRVQVEQGSPKDPWPEVKPSGSQKSLIVLTTPCLSAGGWKPAALANVVAAAVPAPLPVSGWDLARNGPKSTRFAAPAGSVYYLDDTAEGLPPSLADGPDALLGWGCYLKGVWSEHE